MTLLAAVDPTAVLQQTIITWGQVAGALGAIAAVLLAVFRYLVVKPLDRKIAEATKQIQPGANGGQSLSDVNKKVDKLSEAVEDLGARLDRIEERNMEMYDHLLDIVKPRRRKRVEVQDDDSTELTE